MKRFAYLLLLMVLALGLALGGCAEPVDDDAAPPDDETPVEPITIIYTDHNPGTGTSDQINQEHLAAIEELTEGRVKIEMHYGASLVDLYDSPAACSAGDIDMFMWNSDHSTGIFELGVMLGMLNVELTPMFDDLTKVLQWALMEDGIPEFNEEMAQHNLRWVACRALPGTQLHMVDTLVVHPDDLAGKRVGAMGRVADMIDASPGAAVEMAGPPEMVPSLDTGVIDGAALMWAAAMGFKLHESNQYHTNFGGAGLDILCYGWIMNLDTWNKISPSDQAIITEQFKKAMDAGVQYHLEALQPYWDGLIEDGHVIHTLTAEEYAPWEELMLPVHERMMENIRAAGWDADDIYARFRAEIEKYN